jgi:hypothetical protein
VNDKIVGRPIRLNVKKLEVVDDHADVVFIGDVHYGSPQCDVKRFTNMLDYCLKTRTYVLLMGDLIENATRHSVGSGVYEQEESGDEQHEAMVAFLRPLADAGLILGTHRGNHSERTYKESGFDIDKALARELKVTYLGDACWNKFIVGGQRYEIYSLHGRSGARFDGTALLAVERISTSFFADLVCHAHMHKCCNSIVVMQKVRNHLVREHKKHLLITGGYLKYDNSYGSALGLPISKLGSPKVRFFANRHDLVVSW